LYILPCIGYVKLPTGEFAIDPDEQVQAVVRLILDEFDRLGAMRGVLRFLLRHNIKMPIRPHAGPNRGKLEWRRPTHDAVRTLLSGEHRVLAIYGKGGKERVVPLHLEAVERLSAWLGIAAIDGDRQGPLFRPAITPRGRGHDGFVRAHLTTRAVENVVKKYARRLGLDPAVTVHSLRVTALTTARERGADIIDLQDFAGHADPRITLTYIRSRDRLSKSPAYVLNY